MISTRRRPAPQQAAPAEPVGPAAFAEAQAAWAAASCRWQALHDRREGYAAALRLLKGADTQTVATVGDAKIAEWREASHRVYPRFLPRDARIVDDHTDCLEEIERERPAYEAAFAAWNAAQRREARRIADLHSPEHKDAVKRLAEIAGELSLAIDAERAVRAKVEGQARHLAVPRPILPDMTVELGTGSLSEWNSRLQHWARRVRGYIEER